MSQSDLLGYPSNLLSICYMCISVYLCVFLTVLCVYISHGAVCYEVIVSCRGSSMVKVMQVGSCQMAVHPSLGQGAPVPPDRARGERGRRRGSKVDVCHAVSAPPLAAVPAVLGRLLPPRVSFLLLWHVL